MPWRYSIWRMGNSARLQKAPFCSITSESRIAFGPVSVWRPAISVPRTRPACIRVLTTSAGQPHRMARPASGAATQVTPGPTWTFVNLPIDPPHPPPLVRVSDVNTMTEKVEIPLRTTLEAQEVLAEEFLRLVEDDQFRIHRLHVFAYCCGARETCDQIRSQISLAIYATPALRFGEAQTPLGLGSISQFK